MKEEEIINYGIIDFGTKFKGKKWNEVPKHWLEYIISDECYTTEENKNIAKKILINWSVCKGQGKLF